MREIKKLLVMLLAVTISLGILSGCGRPGGNDDDLYLRTAGGSAPAAPTAEIIISLAALVLFSVAAFFLFRLLRNNGDAPDRQQMEDAEPAQAEEDSDFDGQDEDDPDMWEEVDDPDEWEEVDDPDEWEEIPAPQEQTSAPAMEAPSLPKPSAPGTHGFLVRIEPGHCCICGKALDAGATRLYGLETQREAWIDSQCLKKLLVMSQSDSIESFETAAACMKERLPAVEHDVGSSLLKFILKSEDRIYSGIIHQSGA